ncbi:hypothetical protein NC652_001333 [Populus alba x Populus x berolinensis]|uniref:Uncharacterized protein n=1 Tax=Populus alba x Populus x berolinensis TaxID=444605 RepID=A0AAD6WFW9_9ROSI|nr:hypothetical protein NC652_001333 [Populus alba x Populus x berolinensis]KAJ7010882.1 hypothetical protein NC653_001360 [Populus alba x Populus x berolinensis]
MLSIMRGRVINMFPRSLSSVFKPPGKIFSTCAFRCQVHTNKHDFSLLIRI